MEGKIMENENNGGEFERVNLTNLWLKDHIFDLMTKIEQNEVIEHHGSTELNNLFQMDENLIMNTKLAACNLEKSHIKALMDNVNRQLSKNKVLKIKLYLNEINNNQQNYVETFRNELEHTETYRLTGAFYQALDNLSFVKSELIDEISNKGLLLPKMDDELEIKTEKSLEDEDE